MPQAETTASIDPNILVFLTSAGLLSEGTKFEATPLSGGVASDIWKIRAGRKVFVVKKALSRLRVAQEWNVPVSRNASEVAWMLEAAKAAPEAVPPVLAHDPDIGAFAMGYLDPAEYPVWKKECGAATVDAEFARALGPALFSIHSSTADRPDVAGRFNNDANFHAIRLEPYLEATAAAHPVLAPQLIGLSKRTAATKRALMHGDVSPKNILVGPEGPVLLDAECACFGEPAFDLAFCLNHLLLKCVWRPKSTDGYLTVFDALAGSYLEGVTWESAQELEARAAALLPALLLARIDGKSPVEYLTAEPDKAFVRRVARPLIASPPKRLADIRIIWNQEMTP